MKTIKFLSDEQAAQILKVSVPTIRRWRLSGLLSYVRLGPRRIGISEEHIRAFLARGERRAVAEAA